MEKKDLIAKATQKKFDEDLIAKAKQANSVEELMALAQKEFKLFLFQSFRVTDALSVIRIRHQPP